MVLTTEKLLQGGSALATTREGKKVFIADALPDETLKVSITQDKGGYAFAKIDEILVRSEDRIEPACPYWSVCGGCDFQYAEKHVQARLKESIVEDNLRRLGGVDRTSFEWERTVASQGWAYRNRARFHVDVPAKTVGFLARQSNALVPITSCAVLQEKLNTLLSEPDCLFEAAQKSRFNKGRGQSEYSQVPVFLGDDSLSLSGKAVRITIGSHQFMVTNEVFFQSNPFLLPAMAEYIDACAVGDVVMDLYSGVGTFSAFLAKKGRTVISVERDQKCLALAKQNAPDCEYVISAVERWKKKPKSRVDTVVVDPPRVGLDASVPSMIASFKPKRILYVSCNSVTLARDLQRFRHEGYTLQKLRMFDLYPQTFHHEVVAILEKGDIRT